MWWQKKNQCFNWFSFKRYICTRVITQTFFCWWILTEHFYDWIEVTKIEDQKFFTKSEPHVSQARQTFVLKPSSLLNFSFHFRSIKARRIPNQNLKMKYLALVCLIFGIALHMTQAAPAPGKRIYCPRGEFINTVITSLILIYPFLWLSSGIVRRN